MGEQGHKFDGGKLRYDLVPVLAFEDQVKGLTYGATKYDDNNWRNVPEGRKRYMAAAMRHLQEYRKGNIWDDEQGIHHLSAAINNFSFIVEKDLQGWEDSSEEGVVPKVDVDPWIEWNGGDCPVPSYVVVEAKTRDGPRGVLVAEFWDWEWGTGGEDWELVAYRVVKE